MNPSTTPAEPTDRTYRVEFPDLPDHRPIELAARNGLATQIHRYIDPAGSWDFEVVIAEDGRTARIVNDDESDSGYGTLTITEVEPAAAPTPDLLAAVRQVIDAGRLEWGTGVDVDRAQGEAFNGLVRAYEAHQAAAPAVLSPAVLAELVVGMTRRYAESRVMAALHTGRDREWALAAARRQYEAIRRLVASLEDAAAVTR